MSDDIREMLCSLSDSQLDARMYPLIKKWDDSATTLQILEVLDSCINGSLASGFVVSTLQILYDMSCKSNNTTHEEVVKNATWRYTSSNTFFNPAV